MKKYGKILIGVPVALCALSLCAVGINNQVAKAHLDHEAEVYVQEKLAAAAVASADVRAAEIGLVPGDVNLDGSVTALDARFALQSAAELRDLSEKQLINADFDADNHVSLKEVRIILKGAVSLQPVKESAFGISANAVPTDATQILSYFNYVSANLKVSKPTLRIDRTYFTKYAGGIDNPFNRLTQRTKYNNFNNNSDLNSIKNDSTEFSDMETTVVREAGTDLTNSFPAYGQLRGNLTAADISSAAMVNNGDGTYTITIVCLGASFSLPGNASDTALGKAFPMLTTKSQYHAMLQNTALAPYKDYITSVSCAYSNCTITCVIDVATDMLVSAVYSMPYQLSNTISVDGETLTLATDMRDVVVYGVS